MEGKNPLIRVIVALTNLVPMFVFFPSCVLWCWCSRIVFIDFVPAMILMGSIMVELVTHLMLQHICVSSVKPFQRYLVLLVVLLAANVANVSTSINGSLWQMRSTDNKLLTQLVNWQFNGVYGSISIGPAEPLVYERILLYLFASFSFLFVSVKLYRTCIESADALEIYVFKNGKKKTN
jgi:hypothetical protein